MDSSQLTVTSNESGCIRANLAVKTPNGKATLISKPAETNKFFLYPFHSQNQLLMLKGALTPSNHSANTQTHIILTTDKCLQPEAPKDNSSL